METLRSKKALSAIWMALSIMATVCCQGVKEFVDWLYAEDKKFLFLDQRQRQIPA